MISTDDEMNEQELGGNGYRFTEGAEDDSLDNFEDGYTATPDFGGDDFGSSGFGEAGFDSDDDQ